MSKHAPNGRSARIREWLVANPEGGGLHAIRAACDPSASINAVAATLCQLTAAGKASRSGALRQAHYRPTPTTLKDRRRSGRPRSGRPTKAAPAPRRRPAPRPHPQHAAPVARRATDRFLTRQPVPVATANHRTTVADDIARFVAAGGVIQRLPPGATSQPLQHVHAPHAPLGRARAYGHHHPTD